MKNQMKIGIGTLGLMLALAIPQVAAAQDQQQQRHHHHGFRLGICVGQTLAANGVQLPAPTPGQPPVLTDAEKAAFKTAMQTCKAEFKPAPPQQ